MKRIISIIAAMGKNNVIGKDNDMPWGRLPIDLNHFKTVTQSHTVIMGRKTYESIGKPLPNRRNIILTSKKEIEGCEVVTSIQEALDLTKEENEVFIIGGGNIYKQTLELADKLYITLIDIDVEGDTYFPEYNNEEYFEINHSKIKKDKDNKYDCVFLELEKKPNF